MRLVGEKIRVNSHIYIKYVISYICILLVPVIILSFILYGTLIENLENEVLDSTISALNKSKLMIDTQVSQIYGTYYQIMDTNKALKTYLYMNDNSPTRDLYIINELRKHIASNFFISEVALCMESNNSIYTSQGVYSTNLFSEGIYAYNNWEDKAFKSDIFESPRPYVRPGETVNNKERYITFIFPPYMSTAIHNSSLLFLIREEKMQNLLYNNLEKLNGNSFIIDSKNQIITATNYDKKIYINALMGLVPTISDQDTMLVKNISGSNFYVFITNSDYLGWKYVSLLPVESVMHNVVKCKIVFFIGLILVLILGIVAISFFMKINYKPIKQLKTYIEKNLRRTEKNLDEIETVQDAIDYLADQNAKLTNHIGKNITALKDSLIFSLIKGQIETIAEFNRYGKEIGLCFTKKYFRILIIRVNSIRYDDDKRISRKALTAIFSKCISPDYEYFIREDIVENQYICLLAFDEVNKDILDKTLESVSEKVRYAYEIVLTIGVGDEYSDLQKLPISYLNSSAALKHMFIRGDGQIIYYEDICNYSLSMDGFSHDQISDLSHLIHQGNVEKAEELIGSILDYIKKRDTPIFVAKSICFEIIYVVLKADKDIVLQNKYPDIFILEKIETLEQLSDIINQICHDVCLSLKRKKQDKEGNLIDDIISFIKQNYDNCNFNNQIIADHFGMSLSYLSQYFKTNVGRTIVDFTTDLRMEKAKQLLNSTNFKLANISEEVGYYNVSSFIRRFKQEIGVTPGEYRKMPSKYC